jgi:hypothetical protein
MVDVRRRIHFASRRWIFVAIQVRHEALSNLANARNARRYRIGRFTRLAAFSTMIETRRRIRLATVVVKVVAILHAVVAARNGTGPRDTSDVSIKHGRTGFVTDAAMIQTRCRVRFANRVRVTIAFGKASRTAAPRSTRSTRSTRREIPFRRCAASRHKHCGPKNRQCPR